jgi:hypothetical protein
VSTRTEGHDRDRGKGAVRVAENEPTRDENDAGDPACWLELCCPECGAMYEARGTAHLEWCSQRESPTDDASKRDVG